MRAIHPSQPSASAAGAVPAEPHWDSGRLLGATLLVAFRSLRRGGTAWLQFAFLEFTGGVTEQIYWQAASRREFIFGGFRSLLPNLAGLISIKASSSFASLQVTKPSAGSVLGWFFLLIAPCLAPLQRASSWETATSVSVLEIFVAGYLKIRKQN